MQNSGAILYLANVKASGFTGTYRDETTNNLGNGKSIGEIHFNALLDSQIQGQQSEFAQYIICIGVNEQQNIYGDPSIIINKK